MVKRTRSDIPDGRSGSTIRPSSRTTSAARHAAAATAPEQQQVGVISVDHLAEVLIEVTDTVAGAAEPATLLRLVATRTAALSPSLSATVLLTDPEGRHRVAAASTTSEAVLSLFGPAPAEGPWADCVRSGSAVVDTDLVRAHDRWPALVPRAVAAGFATLTAFPLRGRSGVIGALALVSTVPEHLAPRDVRLLQVLANVTAMGLLPQGSSHADAHADVDALAAAGQVQTSLEAQIASEQAKGALAAAHGITIETASDLITDYTQHTHRHPDQVSQDLLADQDLVAAPTSINAPDPQALLTPAEVAALFRVDPKTITRWAKTGQLNAVRTLGGHRRYRHGEVTRLLTED